MQPKLVWKKTAWSEGEDLEWLASLGDNKSAELHYSPGSKHLLIIGPEGWGFCEWDITVQGDLAAQLVACERACLSYLHELYGKLIS